MTHDTEPASAGAGTSPAAASRRAARLGQQPAAARAGAAAPGAALPVALPAAAPIAHSDGPGAPTRRRALLIAGTAAAVLCVTAGAVLLALRGGAADDTATGWNISVSGGDSAHSANALLGEGGGAPVDLERPRPTPTAPPSAPSRTTPPASAEPVAPLVPAAPLDGEPSGPSGDGTTGGEQPSAPLPGGGTSQPSGPQPGSPDTPTAPAAATPLAFTGITPNQTIGLLGIRILSSYTLTLSGQPGSTAAVTYDGSPAGSVTFDGSGRASITVGAGALDLGIGDPLITAAYSDGTPGAPIQARRSAI